MSTSLTSLTTRSTGRLLWEYSLPAVTGMLVMSLYNVVDRVFIGQVVGPDAIAGLAVTFPVMNLSAAFGVLIGAGASARVSILLGQQRQRDAEMVAGNSLTLTLTIACVYLALFGVFIDPLLRAFGASDTTLPYARDFMLWMLPGMLMMNLAFSFNNVMRASGYPIKAMWTMVMGAAINIVLAPIFIYLLHLGIKGAAMATDIAMTISMIFVMSHFARRNVNLHFTTGTYRLRRATVASIMSIGAAPALVNAAACLINIIINRTLLEHGGDTAIAVAGVFVTYTSLITTVILGVCQGMQPIVGYNFGAGRHDRVNSTFLLAVGVSTLLCMAGSAGGILCPELIARAFSSDTTLIDAVGAALPRAMTAFTLVGIQIVATTLFQSIGQARKSIFLSLTRQVIFLIPLLLLLPQSLGLEGVWLSFPSSDLLATVVTVGLLWRQLAAERSGQQEIRRGSSYPG